MEYRPEDVKVNNIETILTVGIRDIMIHIPIVICDLGLRVGSKEEVELNPRKVLVQLTSSHTEEVGNIRSSAKLIVSFIEVAMRLGAIQLGVNIDRDSVPTDYSDNDYEELMEIAKKLSVKI